MVYSGLQALGNVGFLEQVCSQMPINYCLMQTVKVT